MRVAAVREAIRARIAAMEVLMGEAGSDAVPNIAPVAGVIYTADQAYLVLRDIPNTGALPMPNSMRRLYMSQNRWPRGWRRRTSRGRSRFDRQ